MANKQRLSARAKALKEAAEEKEDLLTDLLIAWAKRSGWKVIEDEEGATVTVDAAVKTALRKFLKDGRLSGDEVLDAMTIAFERFPEEGREEWRRSRYFFGVCWATIRVKEKASAQCT